MTEYIPPEFRKSKFNCPHCGAIAHQKWANLIEGYESRDNYRKQILQLYKLYACECQHCKEYSLWLEDNMIYPKSSNSPLPNEDMPEDVKEIYNEARNILNESPRGACALLRLGLEKLMPHLEVDEGSLNANIGKLVEKGLDPKIQKSLDLIRIIGNEAVHPLELNSEIDIEMVQALFHILNYIIKDQISSKKEIEEIWNLCPENKKEGVKNRDKHNILKKINL